MLRFDKVIVEGFGSYVEEAEFKLDVPGINIIRGKNGAGKTTQFSALLWCLYKENLKGVKNAEVVSWDEFRGTGWKGTRVTVNFNIADIDYEIVRCIKYKGQTRGLPSGDGLFIFKKTGADYEVVTDALYKKDQQEYINTLLGMDSKIFTNSILFGQRMMRLIQATGDEKRKIFEEFFELSYIPAAREEARAVMREIENDMTLINNDIINLTNTIDNNTKMFMRLQNAVTEFNTTKELKLSKLLRDREVEVTTYNNIIESLNELSRQITDKEAALPEPPKDNSDLLSDYEKIITEIDKRESYLNTYKAAFKAEDDSQILLVDRIASIIQRIAEFNRTISQDILCETCGSVIPLSKRTEQLKKLEAELKDKKALLEVKTITLKNLQDDKLVEEYALFINDNKKKIEYIKDLMRNTKAVKDEYDKQLYEITLLKEQIRIKEPKLQIIEERVASFDKQYHAEKAQQPPIPDTEDITASIIADKELCAEKQTAKDALEVKRDSYKFWYEQGFSTGGLKFFMFSSMLVTLNQLIKKYANRLDLSITFYIDDTKASKPFITDITNNNITTSYDSLSGGEKQKVDICLAFALHDFICAKSDINILILDEVLEGIDEFGGTEAIYDLIRYKIKRNQAIFVITHSSNIDMMGAREITIEKVNNTSIIVE